MCSQYLSFLSTLTPLFSSSGRSGAVKPMNTTSNPYTTKQNANKHLGLSAPRNWEGWPYFWRWRHDSTRNKPRTNSKPMYEQNNRQAKSVPSRRERVGEGGIKRRGSYFHGSRRLFSNHRYAISQGACGWNLVDDAQHSKHSPTVVSPPNFFFVHRLSDRIPHLVCS